MATCTTSCRSARDISPGTSTRRHTGGRMPANAIFSWKILLLGVIRPGVGMPACSQPGAAQRRAGRWSTPPGCASTPNRGRWNAYGEPLGCSALAILRYVSTPLSIRFDPGLLERLRRRAQSSPGATPSGLAQRLVDEGLRMADHPGVVFKDGPSGRRAALA